MRILESLDDWGDDVAVIEEVEGDLYSVAPGRRSGDPASPATSRGDPDAQWESAGYYGEEASSGSGAAAERSVLDELGEAMGISYEDDEELWLGDKEVSRDEHRWELDPASADDWDERRRR